MSQIENTAILRKNIFWLLHSLDFPKHTADDPWSGSLIQLLQFTITVK